MIQSPYPVLHSVEFFVTEIPWYRCGVDVTAVVHEVMLVVGVLWAKHTQAITHSSHAWNSAWLPGAELNKFFE